MTTPRIKIKNLSIQRSYRPVLLDVSLSVKIGEILCLIGPSGSGKSTVLRCVNRLLEPPPGTVFLDGKDVTTIEVLELRRQVGLLLQEPALFPGTVAENVQYAPRLRGELLSDRELSELLRQVDLPPELADTRVEQISGGERQRVALCRTLANRPPTLLLDEPTAALDPAVTQHIETTILKLCRERGLTALWISHDPEQARRVSDRLVLLVEGSVVDEGKTDQVFAKGSQRLASAFAAGRLDRTGKVENG